MGVMFGYGFLVGFFTVFLYIRFNRKLKIYLKTRDSKPVKCYEIHRPNIPQYGCTTQCKECKEKEVIKMAKSFAEAGRLRGLAERENRKTWNKILKRDN